VRWVHLVAGISWIGASFYFVWLDNHLVPPADPQDRADGVAGELWSVHGGGFYHNQKYPTGPKLQPLTHDLHWFKWEAYTTWLSGIALLTIIYWIGAKTYLIDPRVMALPVPAAIALSGGSLAVGWFVYDALCRALRAQPVALAVTVYVLLLAAAWGFFHLFNARAAFLEVGALMGTIMVANVRFVIIPGQRRVIDAIRAGLLPDPQLGKNGKTRSLHNSYFTLPVIFTMISGHYPMTYGNADGWLVLVLISSAAVLVRHFFILSHRGRVVIGLPVGAAALLAIVAIMLVPRTGGATANAAPVTFAQVQPIIAQRCAVCHAQRPTEPGFDSAPMGLMLDTPERIGEAASIIDQEAVQSTAMPLGNVTKITPQERALLGRWIAAGAKLQ